MKLKIKKLREEAELPFYAKQGDAGMDLKALTVIRTGKYFEYGTGIAMEIEEGYVGLVFPRSSISDTDHFLRNSVGFHFFRKESAFTNLVFSFLADDDGALFFNKKQ